MLSFEDNDQTVRLGRMKTTSCEVCIGSGLVTMGWNQYWRRGQQHHQAVESTTVRWSHGPLSSFGKNNQTVKVQTLGA